MRTDSIYKKLQAMDEKGGTTYFLDLMIFLEQVKKGDKFALACDLVKLWGISTSKTALYAGYAEADSTWQLGVARRVALATEKDGTFDKEQAKLIAQSSFMTLADPQFRRDHPELLLGFAKLEVEKIRAQATLMNADTAVRRVVLLEKKIEDAKQEITKAKAKGGLTPETLKQIEEKLGL